MGSADLARQGLLRGAGRKKKAIATVYVLYCSDGNAVWYCYCLKLGSCGTVLMFYCCFCDDRVRVARNLF